MTATLPIIDLLCEIPSFRRLLACMLRAFPPMNVSSTSTSPPSFPPLVVKLGGDVEVDETFIGGKARNMHASKRRKLGISQSKSMIGKVAVMGLLERHRKDDGGSQVRTLVIANRKKHQLETSVTDNVEQGANLYTD